MGLFTVLKEKQSYLDSITSCKTIGADLADVTSETRTKYLSSIINDSLDLRYKVAYVGMDDLRSARKFATISGVSLSCRGYRAWAPGHPQFELHQRNCVVLDAEMMWRVVDCGRKLPALCEFFPNPPKLHNDFGEDNCQKIHIKCK